MFVRERYKLTNNQWIYMKKLFTAFGFISLALGLVGIFIPLLPTTPFLLLSAWLFAKSSERWHRWLLQHKRLGKYIRQFQEDKSIPLRIKIIAVSMLWVTILFSVIVVVKTLWLKMLLLAITIGVSIHILSFKTRKHTLPMK
ncbi:Inner membrane protein YbaN [termite gut metagenome]|uniref:Inner membrane protein YbaN n=1 Tax=termite gut metagenome TaxID=433724 RepID=A0A5J4SPB7_9ZZZZ